MIIETLADRKVTVGGIFEDLPSNSSIQYDIILSLASIPYFEWDGRLLWSGNDRYESFVKLKPKANLQDVNLAIQQLSHRHIPPEISQNNTSQTEYYLYPLTKAYSYINANSNILYILSFISFMVLATAILNYVMFTLSALLKRCKEFAIQK